MPVHDFERGALFVTTLSKNAHVGGLKDNELIYLKSVTMSDRYSQEETARGRCKYKFVKAIANKRSPSHDDRYDASEDFEFVLWDHRDRQNPISNARQYGSSCGDPASWAK